MRGPSPPRPPPPPRHPPTLAVAAAAQYRPRRYTWRPLSGPWTS